MQARREVYTELIRHCRLLRNASDVVRVRAVLDVEEELTKLLVACGGEVPPVHRGLERWKPRNSKTAKERSEVVA